MKAILTKEEYEGLDDVFKAEYVEGSESLNGMFVLKVEPVNGYNLENTGGLKKSLQATRAERDKLNADLKAFEGLDPSAAKDALKKLEELGDLDKLNADTKKQIEVIKSQLEQKAENDRKTLTSKFETDLSSLGKERDTLRSQLQNQMITNRALAVLDKLGGRSQLLLPLIEKTVRIAPDDKGVYKEQVLDSEGNPRLSSRPGVTSEMTLEEYLGELRENPEFAPAFKSSGAHGSGAEGSSSNSSGSFYTISEADARDTTKYKAARDAAAKAGKALQIR